MNQGINQQNQNSDNKKTSNQKNKTLSLNIASNIFFCKNIETFGIQMKFEDKAEKPDISHTIKETSLHQQFYKI